MRKNTDDNPMPIEGEKKSAVALKSLIGIFAVTNCIMSIPSLEATRKGEKGKIAMYDGINLLLTVVDFGLSCGVGYGLYSPMDSSNERIKDLDYTNSIADTSKAAGLYSDVWILKMCISVFEPSFSTIWKIADEKKLDDDVLDLFDAINTAFYMGICCLSMIFELNACIEAGKVDGNKLNDNQKRDKSCFLCETVGYICDDACSIVDCIMSIGELNNIPIFVAREAFEAAYAISMFTEAGIIYNE